MHAYKFGLIVVLSCIAMIGAIPVGNHVPVEAIVRRGDGLGTLFANLVMYVPSVFAVTVRGGSNLVKNLSPVMGWVMSWMSYFPLCRH